MSRHIVIVLGLVGLLLALAPLLLRGGPDATQATGSDVRPAATPSARGAVVPTAAHASAAGTDGELIAFLRAQYGANIDHVLTQMRMLERLMRTFRSPDGSGSWDELLAAVRAAFPELADEIAELFEARLAYENWLRANREWLESLEPAARRQALDEIRAQLFGKEVADELWANEKKSYAVAAALATIDATTQMTVRDKLSQYRGSLESIYGEHAAAYLDQHRHEAMTRFLSLESVQGDLAAMTSEARREALRDIRSGMGLDAAALARWDELDAARDDRWRAGESYMAERASLAETYAGDELDRRLDELRQRVFGAEADIVHNEEVSGFFRFARARQWGRQ